MDALLRASNELCTALQGTKPESKAMENAVNALVKIFKRQAGEESTVTDKRRAQRDEARLQRVASEKAEAKAQRVTKNAEIETKQWIRHDANTKCFLTIKKGGLA